MRDVFNANFYIVSATVIPLFYITLTLQGPMFEDLQHVARRAGTSMDKAIKRFDTDIEYPSKWRRFAYGLHTWIMIVSWATIATVTFIFAGLIILAGIAGEIISLLALYHESDTPITRSFVLWSMIGLLGLIPIRPALAIFKVTWIDWSEPKERSPKGE